MTAELPSRIGPYLVTELLGRGGSSPVYKATDPASGRAVVVRLLSSHLRENPAAAERFDRESRALNAAPHPNVVHVVATGTAGTEAARPYLVTEYFPGLRLDQLLRERRLTVPEIVSVMKGICRGLAHIHQNGVLHHHLSPHAVLVSPDLSAVKLNELGFTRVESLGLTGTISTGAISLSSFHYLAPEQADSSGSAAAPDHRADLYAAGVIFQEMITGRPPGGKFNLPSQSNSEALPETDVIVLKCLARNPSERYATAIDLLADLGRLEEALRVRLLSEIRGITQKAAGPRRGLILAGIVLLLAVLVVAGYLLAR